MKTEMKILFALVLFLLGCLVGWNLRFVFRMISPCGQIVYDQAIPILPRPILPRPRTEPVPPPLPTEADIPMEPGPKPDDKLTSEDDGLHSVLIK